MRRARQIEMENMANSNVTLSSSMANSQFFKKFLGIPVVKFGVDQASSVYGKVKDFNTITHKSFELAENVTGAVMGRVTPFAQKGISIVTPSLERIDSFAAQGLENLEHKVPAINKEPNVMITDVKNVVWDTLEATKNRVTDSSEMVLVSKPVQTYFDFLEFILVNASKTLDKVLPPTIGDEITENGSVGTGPDKQAYRGWWLMGQFFDLLGIAKTRVVNKFRTRIDSTSDAADLVYKKAKNAVNYALPVASDKDTPTTTNGDSNNKPANKQGKKKNQQEKNNENN